jgi:hypothetical protein
MNYNDRDALYENVFITSTRFFLFEKNKFSRVLGKYLARSFAWCAATTDVDLKAQQIVNNRPLG